MGLNRRGMKLEIVVTDPEKADMLYELLYSKTGDNSEVSPMP